MVKEDTKTNKDGQQPKKAAAQSAKAAGAKADAAKKQIDELEAKLAHEKEDYARLMAEFDTFRRRTKEEKDNILATASAETIKGLLPTLDDCERALAILEQSSDDAAKEGTALIYNKLMDYLKSKGLERIEAKGQPFDTDFHEAVTQFPAPSEELKGKVIDVVQNGYILAGKVIRFAKVVVGV